MIYVEIENNIPIKSTAKSVISNKFFKNSISTDFEDYTPTNKKYKFENGKIVLNPDYQAEQTEQERLIRVEELKKQLSEIDKKRIRAVCEPSNGIGGESWLEYYNKQAQNLRAELQELEGAANDSNSKK